MVAPMMTFGGAVQAGMPPRSRIPGVEQHHVTQKNLTVRMAQSLQRVNSHPRSVSPSAPAAALSFPWLPAHCLALAASA